MLEDFSRIILNEPNSDFSFKPIKLRSILMHGFGRLSKQILYGLDFGSLQDDVHDLKMVYFYVRIFFTS